MQGFHAGTDPGVTYKAGEVSEGGPLVRDYAHGFILESACLCTGLPYGADVASWFICDSSLVLGQS